MTQERRPQRRTESERFPFRDVLSRMIDDRVLEPFEEMMPMSDMMARSTFPKIDIEEDDQNVIVKANIPGVDPENVELNVEEHTLTISGTSEREERSTDEETQYYHYEREYGEFRRDVPLPANVDPDAASATTKNGVLRVTLPKVSQDTRKRIEITNEES